MGNTFAMKLQPTLKSILINLVSYSYILLFTYAGFSKLLDYQNFTVQLGQSPLLSAYSQTIGYTVPLLEFLIVLLLVISKYRYTGLLASFSLMVMFTTYIFIILHYSSFIPCSCGGILEKLNWQQHLLFNLVFVALALLGIFGYQKGTRKKILICFLITLSSIAIVAILYGLSENSMQYHNKFIRRLSNGPAIKSKQTNLQFNSYYFAGINDDKIYLGNTTAQLLVTTIDTALQTKATHNIELDKKDFAFSFLKVKVTPSCFYVFDGTVPGIYKGNTNTWKAKFTIQPKEYFSLAEAIDSSSVAIRSQKRGTGESILAKVTWTPKLTTILKPSLLQKQQDGVFDTDGHLLISAELNKIIYLYAYRNQYLVADKNLNLQYRGNTIDTISKANLDIVNIKSHNEKKLGKQPLIVNKNASVYNNLLFVNSGIPGRYESLQMWKQASIIDVYDLLDKRYLTSFYIEDIENAKVKSFIVHKNRLYALIGNYLVSYNLSPTITKQYKK